MTKRITSMLLVCLMAGFGCVSDDSKDDAAGDKLKKLREKKRSVPSTVVHVNKVGNFVLLENYLQHAPGTLLSVHRGDRMIGRLRVTSPARKNLISADILGGAIERGDIAYLE